MIYVTYDADGMLTSGYNQELRDEHVDCNIEVDQDVQLNWSMYRANSTRDGVERLADVNFDARKALAIAQTYLDVDAVTLAAVGQRGEEYKSAEAAARDFSAAGYVGEPVADVSSYAQFNPTGEAQSNRWAADQIIARADAFRAAQTAMRCQRFEAQATMRGAQDTAALAVAVSAWESFIASVRAQLEV